uniref:Variant surface glycoprotein 1125.56 n=1 Tax=Trypanosoma brucei TaxID=5691 RepID=A0A1J0R440_9TRYP|nr:variant surface glycoprotein 1125.56 [Trypanosoma brucei]
MIAIMAAQSGDATNNHGLNLKKAQAICKLSKELKGSAMRAGRDSRSKITAILELEAVFAAMIPNATKGTADDDCADYDEVYQEANRTVTETIKKIPALAETAAATAAAAGRAAGVLDEFLAALAQGTGAGTTYCIQGSDTNAATQADLADCLNTDLKPQNMVQLKDTKVEAASQHEADLTKLAKALAAAGTVTSFAGSQATKGCGLVVGAADGIMVGQALSGSFAWAQGLIRFGAGNANGLTSTGVTADSHTTTAADANLHWASDPEKIPVIAEAIALAEGYKSIANSIAERPRNTIEKVKTCMKAKNKEIKREPIFLNVSHLNRELKKAVAERDKALSSQHANTTPKQQTNCSNKKETECGTAPGCGWRKAEGKCEAKDDGQGETNAATGTGDGAAGNTANTTASNSFVIKTSPLWLAVLLF